MGFLFITLLGLLNARRRYLEQLRHTARETPVPQMQGTSQADNCARVHTGMDTHMRQATLYTRPWVCAHVHAPGGHSGLGGLLSLLTNYQTLKVPLF